MLAFVLRLIGYGVVFGLTARVSQMLWTQQGLDGIGRLTHFHNLEMTTLIVAPIVLALVGFGALRSACVFIAFFLVAAALTAPFTIARVIGA
jgi:hypothetical protein